MIPLKALTNVTLVMKDHLIPDGVLLMEQGRIQMVRDGKIVYLEALDG